MSTDALIMLRRNFKHTARNPVTVFNAVLLPIVIMLMFVYMLGNAFSVGVWLGVSGIVVAACFATSWLTVAMGLAAKTPQSAGLATVPLIMLPFFSSAIVPAAKMGQGVRQFAQYQPFTPIIESLRGLLAGTPSGGYAAAALAWCVGIALVGYLWSLATFKKRA